MAALIAASAPALASGIPHPANAIEDPSVRPAARDGKVPPLPRSSKFLFTNATGLQGPAFSCLVKTVDAQGVASALNAMPGKACAELVVDAGEK